jgi:hypothetical protein
LDLCRIRPSPTHQLECRSFWRGQKPMNSSSIDSDNQNVTLGVLRGDDTGLHEVIGL